jgi:uncharacterized protein with FMN-binding domain
MKPRNRYTSFASAAALATVMAIGSVKAAEWSPSGLFSRLLGQTGQSPPAVAPATDSAPGQLAAGGRYHDGNFAGPATNTYYGPVQVQAHIQNGRLVSVDVPRYPADRRASQRINNQALPLLEREVISAQSARVNIISGATLTSEAYLRSLDAALHQAESSGSETDI